MLAAALATRAVVADRPRRSMHVRFVTTARLSTTTHKAYVNRSVARLLAASRVLDQVPLSPLGRQSSFSVHF